MVLFFSLSPYIKILMDMELHIDIHKKPILMPRNRWKREIKRLDGLWLGHKWQSSCRECARPCIRTSVLLTTKTEIRFQSIGLCCSLYLEHPRKAHVLKGWYPQWLMGSDRNLKTWSLEGGFRLWGVCLKFRVEPQHIPPPLSCSSY
jgi:hypothetical protein